MSHKFILFADNDPDFLQTRAEFLQNEGYYVVFANSPVEAERLLNNGRIHLAILDVRLSDDDDEKDISGILLAQKEEFRSVPKIILTGFPSPYTSRDALRPHLSGFQPAINYIGKEEGQDVLVTAVNDAFVQHVRINWNLSIDWKAGDSSSLVRIIEPSLEREYRLSREEELEDLFQRLFYEKDHIRIERLLWRRKGRAALIVLTFREGIKPESFVVVCGQNAIVNEEAHRFDKFSPDVPGRTGTRLNARAETTHFASIAYAFAKNDLENIMTLVELYRIAQPHVFKETLNRLFEETLHEWHLEKSVHENNSLVYHYRRQLNSKNELPSKDYFEATIREVETQSTRLRSRIERSSGKVKIHFTNGQSFSYVDPFSLLFPTHDPVGSTLVINVPGTLTGENILADETGRTWLTDFAEAGMAPLFWNYVALESAIRFDWVETSDLLRRQEMEHCLINSNFAKPDIRDLEPNVRKPAQAISMIRKLAARIVGRDERDYQLSLFFQAAHRLADYHSGFPLTVGELARLAHAWLAMAMIAEKLNDGKNNPFMSKGVQTSRLRIKDEIARTILVGNHQVDLAPQPFALLHYLFLNANRVCTKEELIQNVLKNEYKEDYLHTLIGRVRKVIEDDPETPLYLITVPNAGYRLIPNPE